MSAVAVGVALIVVAVARNFPRARTDISRTPCIIILRWIDEATQKWGLENGKTTDDTATWDNIRPYLSRDGKIPSCPQGGKYTLGRKGTPPTCSYEGHRLP